jgi:hypothetical protein
MMSMEPSSQLVEAHWDAHQTGLRIGVLGAVTIRLKPNSPLVLKYIGEKFNEHLEKKWRLRRACLLSLSQVWKSLPKVIIRSVSWLEKRRSAHLPLYYRFSHDYF